MQLSKKCIAALTKEPGQVLSLTDFVPCIDDASIFTQFFKSV